MRRSKGITQFNLNFDTRWKWAVKFTPQPIYLREIAPVPISLKAGWAPETVWTPLRREKNTRLHRDSDPEPSSPAQLRYNDSYSSPTGPGNLLFLEMSNTLTPELNPPAQRCLPRYFTGILIFKGLTARHLFKSFGVKGLNWYASDRWQWRIHPAENTYMSKEQLLQYILLESLAGSRQILYPGHTHYACS
jgi:hypothetical protein